MTSCWKGGAEKHLILKMHLHMGPVFALELDICLWAGEDDALPGTVFGTKLVLIIGCQMNGLNFPFHNLPLLPNGVMEEMKIRV